MSKPIHPDLTPDRGGSADRRPDQEIKKAEAGQSKLDKKLDEALEESFPGSDPVNLVQPPKSPKEKH